MRRRLLTALLVAVVVLGGCAPQYQKYSTTFTGTFDTAITLMGYATSEGAFTKIAEEVYAQFVHYHQLFDGYNAYDGINNLYTLNHRAMEAPVEVGQPLFDLLMLAKQLQGQVPGTVNIAMGSVLQLWHDAREDEMLPDSAALAEANQHTNMDDLLLDEAARTVYYADPLLQLDIGAVAKGYAAELVAQWLETSAMPSFLINAGGNIRAGNAPLDGRSSWSVSVQNPDGGDALAVLHINNTSAVTSGDYQRYVTLEGVRYHHIIDGDTLYPAAYVRAVTVCTRDSGLADFLSTALFLMPYAEGLQWLEDQPVGALWVLMDGSVQLSPGMDALIQ